ncbi:hypothetical protein [Paenibacillus antibioticophila]|uniref:hypothetical protein n=1 Tax=Paenibacillus antibioticophila TaxID=1274374 RepID=UPI001BB30014|nr:hypothetical protein [Paenibacillus antibioticophila]
MSDHEKQFFPKVFVGSRKSGKTTALLQRAEETKIPILTHDENMKSYLKSEAKRRGHENVKVLTVNDLHKDGRRKPEKVIVDEAQLMLERLLGTRMDCFSATSYDIVTSDTLDFQGGDDGQPSNAPLLVIEVQDMESVPVVRYKGETLTGKVQVGYEWETKGCDDLGKHSLSLEYFDQDQQSVKCIKFRRFPCDEN